MPNHQKQIVQYSIILSGADYEFDEERFNKNLTFAIFFATGLSGSTAIANVHLGNETMFWFGISIVCFVLCFFVLVRHAIFVSRYRAT